MVLFGINLLVFSVNRKIGNVDGQHWALFMMAGCAIGALTSRDFHSAPAHSQNHVDRWAASVGLVRGPKENDDSLRARVRQEIRASRRPG